MVSLAIVAIAIPAETILVKALTTPNEKTAAAQWVQSLSAESLAFAAADLPSYRFAYRKAILGALGASGRADAWRAHVDAYLASHADLGSDAVVAIQAGRALLTSDFFAMPTDAQREQARLVAEQVAALTDRETAEYLFYRLGPADSAVADAQPLLTRLALAVRGVFVASARRADDCECSTGFGCDGAAQCKGSTGCVPDTEWPACGWFWNDDCDGTCGFITS